MQTKVNLHNRFDVEVKDTRTGKIRQRAFAENVILNQAWAIILSNVDWFDRIYYGTGSGTISAARTALFTPLSNKVAANSIYTENIEDNWFSHRQSIAILENEHVGVTLSEVGIGTATTLCTHALMRDMNGNPVSIVKTDTDIITIFATVYARPSTVSSDTAGIDFVRAGVEENPLLRTLLGRRMSVIVDGDSRVIDGWSFNLYAGMADTLAGVHLYSVSTPVPATVDVANKKATWYHRIAAAAGNVGGLKRYTLHAYRFGLFTYTTRPAILARLNADTVTQSAIIEQIGTGNGAAKDFKTTFPFVKQGAVIKVDGVAASPTVITGAPNAKDITGFLRNRTNSERPDRNMFGVALTATPEILENPMYANFGITSVTGFRFVLESSDDGTSWSTAVTSSTGGSAAFAIPTGHQNKRYFRVSRLPGYTDGQITSAECSTLDGYKNVRFETAPETGAVITAEYTCDVMAKDVNHVYDITVVIQLGEYTP